MALNDIVFVKSQGGLGRPLPGSDYISGMVFYTGTLPSGFTTTYNKKQIFSVSDAVTLGITNDYSDETKATGTYLITTAGSTGDTINISVSEPTITGVNKLVDLGTYTKVAGDSTIALLGASITAFINAGTLTHGYSASFATATITLTARTGMGIALNSGTPIVVTIVGTIAGTLTQFGVVAGVASKLALWYYHISEYFRLQPQGNLWVGFYPVPSSYTFTEMNDLQTYATGTIRQILVYNDVARTAAQVATDCTALMAAQVIQEALHQPYEVIYAPNIKAITDLSTLTNLGLLTAYKVSVCIGQDAGGMGAWLYLTEGKSITNGGAMLGTVSLSKVSDNIAWVAQYNQSNGVECDTVGFSNGVLFTAMSPNLRDNQLNSYRYVYLRKFTDIAGSYFNDSHTAVVQSSDYAYIENNRTIDKAVRVSYTALLPSLNSPLRLNPDGTLTNITVAAFTGILSTNLNAMVRNEELSAYEVVIDLNQNVLATSTLVVRISLLINGVARNIIVNIGFTTSL
jgi:hypothetical protein